MGEIGERDRKPVAAERCCELRIERRGRQHAETVGENLEIALQRVTDDGSLRQRRRERLQVADAQWIDDGDLVADDQLHDHQARSVGFFVVKLGVERNPLRTFDALAECGKRGRVLDQHGRHGVGLGFGLW